MIKKGFLLVDSLIVVIITTILCFMCYQIYLSTLNYEQGYQNFQTTSNEYYEDLYNDMPICEACTVDESD